MAHHIPLRPHRRLRTTNGMGWSSNSLNEVSELFVKACGPGLTALDIGAALGVATLPALAAGAVVHASDASAEQLSQIAAQADDAMRARLILHAGRFHKVFTAPEASIDLAHASNVFHFFTGRQLQLAAATLNHVLKPGGRVYVIAATPFMGPFVNFIPVYERNIVAGEAWPGWIENVRDYSDHRLLAQFPKSVHLLDQQVLTRVFSDAGFAIEQSWYLRRWDLPKSVHHDGRENVALIARKLDAAAR
jgi:ubiquinone/menaquinone biosynthesis C-methylase UbiE